jgi:prepilin-type N-terminal cleavage/methylation domain-containing protein
MRRAAGFSLVEVLVALALLAVLMIGATAIYWQQRAVSRRIDAQRTADRVLENAYEQLRLVAQPLENRTSPVSELPDGTLSLSVSEGTVPGTWRVDLVVSYRLSGRPFRRTLIALLRP